jgi:hypothetical protein
VSAIPGARYPNNYAPLPVALLITISNANPDDKSERLELLLYEQWIDFSSLLLHPGAQTLPLIHWSFSESTSVQARLTFADGATIVSVPERIFVNPAFPTIP